MSAVSKGEKFLLTTAPLEGSGGNSVCRMSQFSVDELERLRACQR